MFFQVGEVYERDQILDVLEAQRSGPLPLANGKVACGLFDPSTEAVTRFSGELDYYPKKLAKNAQALEEGDDLPIFLKITAKQWRYGGIYRFQGMTQEKRALDKAKQELGRVEVAAILKFSPKA